MVLHNDMQEIIKSKTEEIKSLKLVVERRDAMIAEMRTKMLTEIVQLRDSLFKRKKDKNQSYRADMFNNLDMLDPKVAEVVQIHISEIEEKHRLHYD